jgi:hypothetical protein
VPVAIPYILKGYCQTRSILAEMCRLKSKINGYGPVVGIDLTAAVEHLYRRGCLLLWLGWVDICCRGRSGHGLQGKIRLYTGANHYTGATARPTNSDCLLLAPRLQARGLKISILGIGESEVSKVLINERRGQLEDELK